jgi:hypothetical protein
MTRMIFMGLEANLEPGESSMIRKHENQYRGFEICMYGSTLRPQAFRRQPPPTCLRPGE